MNDNEILQFKASIQDFSVEELEKAQADIKNEISKMILNSDLIIKAAIIDAALKDKKEKDA